MASTFRTSHNKGSDVVYEVCCSVCEEDGICKEGLFYCQKCSKTFCSECVQMHNKIHKDHSVSAKGECDKWPVTKQADDTIELCEEHSTEKLTLFCEDHGKLLCQLCLFHNHRQCSHVVLLSEQFKYSTPPLDVAELLKNIEQFQKRLGEAVDRSEQNIKSLQASYENILEDILDFRRQINNSLDRLQQQTVIELDKLHSSLKNSLDDERNQCETCISKLKVHDTKGIQSPEKAFILCRKYLDQTASAELFLQKAPTAEIEFQHNKDLEQFLAACTDLGTITSRVPNKVINVQEKSQFTVGTNTDRTNCTITGICETSNGNLVISECYNQCVNLLDQTYNILAQVKLTTHPWSMCNISPTEVAVTISDHKSLNEIHFLRVDTGKIITIKHIQLNHLCYGIAHHKGDMFVTSGTSLLLYSTDGRLVKKLYEDKSATCSVIGVAVSPNRKRIYLTDTDNGRLVTLTIDGGVTATLQDNAFKYRYRTCSIHVAATGQVFILGNQSISQVDTDGKKLLATVDVDGCPRAVYFNIDKSKLLVGMHDHDSMTEFKTTIS